MADKHNVAMFIQKDGEKVQVGWASPAADGVRTFEFSPGYSDKDNRPALKNVSFEDDEHTQEVAAEQEASNQEDVVVPAEEETPAPAEESYPQEGDEGKDSAPIVVEPNEVVETESTDTQPTEIQGGTVTEVTEVEAPKAAPQQNRPQQNRNRNKNNQRKS